ncbi:low-density lipoprotein receptor-related protein 2-like [Saccostrea cucullata]|uniref:low-density lipoprotein receptor-related protein 2-like n=1 Tax=Saccostrea cuccullata TaxID=36930 RepID=UPI002ED20A0E
MCHNVKGSYKCMCYDGFSDVKGKGTKCKAEGMTAVFFTTGHEIRQIILDRKDYSGTVNSGQYLGGIDVDMGRKLIYWTDTSMKKIRRAGIPQNMKVDTEALPQDLNIATYQPEDVAIDWVARNIYWTDSAHNTISVAKSDGRYAKVLIREDLGVSIGYCFDENADGSDRVTVIGRGIINPISLDVFESTLYWASQQTGKLMTMDKFGRGVNVTLQAGLLLPSSLKIFHPRRHNMTVKNRCLSSTERCSHLCLLTPDGFRCACPERAQFRDPFTCDAAWEEEIPDPELCICYNGGTCLMINGSKSCQCLTGYSGEECLVKLPEKLIDEESATDVVGIIVPVIVVTIVTVAFILFLFILKKKGKLLLKARDLKVGSSSVSYRDGGNVQIAPPFNFEEPNPNLCGSEIDSTNFSNPMFFKEEGLDTTLRSAPDIAAPADSITLSQSGVSQTNGHVDSTI